MGEALVGWRDACELTEIRPVAREALHVTLCFLGARPEEQIARIAELALSPAGEVNTLSLSLARAVWLPPRRPRVLAVELDDPAGQLRQVQSEVSGALAEGVGYMPERRPFLPHVTVARVPAPAQRRRPAPAPPPPLGFAGEAITLYRSRLSRAGARYEALASIEL